MNNNKREQERNELYRTIWTLANELRGSTDCFSNEARSKNDILQWRV